MPWYIYFYIITKTLKLQLNQKVGKKKLEWQTK
jgi:hypothetical protein